MPRLGLRLTPHGHLLLDAAEDAPILDKAVAERLAEAFGRSPGHGLVQLGAGEVGQALPPVFVWWRNFASRYVTAVCLHGAGEPATGAAAAALPDVPAPDEGELASLVLTAPMMVGAEYLTPDVLRSLWAEMAQTVAASLTAARTDL